MQAGHAGLMLICGSDPRDAGQLAGLALLSAASCHQHKNVKIRTMVDYCYIGQCESDIKERFWIIRNRMSSSERY